MCRIRSSCEISCSNLHGTTAQPSATDLPKVKEDCERISRLGLGNTSPQNSTAVNVPALRFPARASAAEIGTGLYHECRRQAGIRSCLENSRCEVLVVVTNRREVECRCQHLNTLSSSVTGSTRRASMCSMADVYSPLCWYAKYPSSCATTSSLTGVTSSLKSS